MTVRGRLVFESRSSSQQNLKVMDKDTPQVPRHLLEVPHSHSGGEEPPPELHGPLQTATTPELPYVVKTTCKPSVWLLSTQMLIKTTWVKTDFI